MADSPRLLFGLVPPSSFEGVEARVTRILRDVSEQAGVMLVRRNVESYDHLAGLMRKGEIDVAWLPPIPFSRLSTDGLVQELVCGERSGRSTYTSVFIARADKGIRNRGDLRGKRVGWVDPLSAAGYVVPRVRLAAAGIDPSKIFGSETFLGSHRAVARAVHEGSVDVGATFAGFGEDGELLRAAFLELGLPPEALVVVDSFGAIPPDVIAVQTKVTDAVRERLAAAFEGASGELLDAIRAVFGVVRFIRQPVTGYDMLRSEVEDAADSGVIPAAAAFLSTRPPKA